MKEHDYSVISLDQFVELKKEGKKIPRKSVVITFDDGYVDNYLNAYPVLKKYKSPAIIFIPSSHVGTEGVLNISQMKEMLDSGLILIGSHSMTHAYLPDLSEEQQKVEIQASKISLEYQLGQPVKYFAYPVGGFTEKIKEFLQESGYEAGIATNRGFDKKNNDLFELNRVSMRDGDTGTLKLLAKFSGYFNVFRSEKNPY